MNLFGREAPQDGKHGVRGLGIAAERSCGYVLACFHWRGAKGGVAADYWQ